MFRKIIKYVGLALALLPGIAWAVNVTVDSSFTLVLPSDSSSYTVNGGTFDSITINSSTFSIEIPVGFSLLMSSADSKNMTVSSGISSEFTCDSTGSTLRLNNDGTETVTVTVTPSGDCTSGDGGGGGGGGDVSLGSGGGGGGSYTPIPETTTTTTQAPVVTQQAVTAPTVMSASAMFEVDLDPGEDSSDVQRLQELLAQDSSIYPEGIVSGYYGSLTAKAVRAFQAKYGISTVGRVGPQTRAKLQEVFGGTSSVAPSAAALSVSSPPSAVNATGASSIFSQDMDFEDENAGVERLQELLAQDSSIYPEGIVSGYYGSLTKGAVQRFQEKYGVASAGSLGYGRVGPATRAKLQEVFGGTSSVAPSASDSGTSAAQPVSSDNIAQIQALQEQLLQLQLQLLQAQIEEAQK